MPAGKYPDRTGPMSRVIRECVSAIRVVSAVRVSIAIRKTSFKAKQNICRLRFMPAIVSGIDMSDARARIAKLDCRSRLAKLCELVVQVPGVLIGTLYFSARIILPRDRIAIGISGKR